MVFAFDFNGYEEVIGRKAAVGLVCPLDDAEAVAEEVVIES